MLAVAVSLAPSCPCRWCQEASCNRSSACNTQWPACSVAASHSAPADAGRRPVLHVILQCMPNTACDNVCRLREAIQSAADQASSSHNSSSSSTASDRDRGPSAKHLKPIVTAVEMVFGSAAALSATFGFKALPTNFPYCVYPLQHLCDRSTNPS